MIPFQHIIDALNKITGKHFRLSEAHKKFIRARWAEGFRFEDFIYVIRVKSDQWLGTDQAEYLRPRTLFGTKMDDYKQKRYRRPPSERQPEPIEQDVSAEDKINQGYSLRYIKILRERKSFDWDAVEFERLKEEWGSE